MEAVRVGIDVARRQCAVQLQIPDRPEKSFTIQNTRAGHEQLLRELGRYDHEACACMEATGVYGLDLALALSAAAEVDVMVLNPRRARRFAEASGKRAKTDSIDAAGLLEYCTRMPFESWTPPPKGALELRALTRRMNILTEQVVQEKNRLHAAEATAELRVIRTDIKRSIRSLEAAVLRLEKKALVLIEKHSYLRDDFQRLCSVTGIAERSAAKILAELATMPQDLTAKQLTAYAGLDPTVYQSGTSVQGTRRISKRGNVHLRNALYMPAHSASRTNPVLRDMYNRLIERGKPKMKGKVAVMRKLLLICNALRRDKTFFQERSLKKVV